MYDGVNTPALPVTFESKEHSGTGHPSQKQLYTIFATTANFSNAHYWTGYIDADTVSNPWTVWPESYKPYKDSSGNAHADGITNQSGEEWTHQDEIYLTPNPSTGLVKVEGNISAVSEIVVMDLNGRIIATFNILLDLRKLIVSRKIFF